MFEAGRGMHRNKEVKKRQERWHVKGSLYGKTIQMGNDENDPTYIVSRLGQWIP